VVRDRHRVKAERGPLFGEVVDAPESVQQAELGVEVQVDEVVGSYGHGG
jgi:hypothetical protein